jgi:serine/threonine protein kinase
MWKQEQYSLDSIGIEGSYRIEQIPSISLDVLPIYLEKTHTLTSPKGKRAMFLKETSLGHGSYGNLYLTIRETDGEQKASLLKQPRLAEMNLIQEGILQHIAQKTAEHEGIGWCIPKVYDVFLRQQKVWFSMEYIAGISVLDWFSKSLTPDRDFLFLLAQICLSLLCLETNLGLDHRDLKLDNLLIKQQPCTLQLTVKEKQWTLTAPFTVVILDFGFACLGSKELRGKPVINLGDGILPPMDPCPKEGRDLFQLLTSFLRYELFSKKISSPLHQQIDTWLSIGSKSYGPMARRWSTENWTYLVASQRDFAVPSCCPLNILKDILPALQGHLSMK